MAARMRVYVPQRHRLPLMAASISSLLGFGTRLSSAQADINCPLWQYPHCTTSTCVHARRNASICWPCTPSMVLTSRPCTAASGVTHERTASPSRCTVHAPHNPLPQPYLDGEAVRSEEHTSELQSRVD